MSTYQYYEFQAIDRPLTPEEQEAVAQLSSRVHPDPRRAVFVYHWSSFRGRAEDILARYYDAMLYVANWGTKQLMFRFPRSAIDLGEVQAYCRPRYVDEFISFSTVGEHAILGITFREEEGYDWIEGEGRLDALLPLRDDILRGDYRALYQAWLKTLEVEDILHSVVEPPVPTGLRELTPALLRFVELFEIDELLVKVAAEASAEREAVSDDWLGQAIATLSRNESDAFLLRLAQGEPHLGLALKKRLRALAGGSVEEQASRAPRRTVGQLLAQAEQGREEAERRRAEEAERKRIAELEAMAEREAESWQEVDALIGRKTGSAYEDAVQLLRRLRDLAEYKGRAMDFQGRVREIRERYSRRSALMRRLREAGL